MATHLSLDEAREIVEREYGGPLPDQTWDTLVNRRWINELRNGLCTSAEVVEEIRAWNQAAPLALRRSIGRGREETELFRSINLRTAAVAEFAALRAGRDMSVANFRRHHLGPDLLSEDAVGMWIDARYRESLPPDWPTDIGPGDADNHPGRLTQLPPGPSLEWLEPGTTTLKIWRVPPRSVLARLAELAQKLAKYWDWHPAHATVFVLTGATPPRPAARQVRFKSTHGGDDRFGPYFHMSVRVTLDATLTPEELAGWWRGIREDLGTSGYKPVGERSIALARFLAHRGPETSWRQDMEAWNAEAPPEWRYTDRGNFRTAALNAWQRLNSPVPPHRTPM